ncbi:MAG: aminotransferase class V-fold PLP-dependent enzyme [Sporomusaceae bacterium]|nr:aminotransferase class V-fold PLP-dependent enzyme [Sporomusaceae bacterium]
MNLIYLNNAATSWPKAPLLGAKVATCLEEIPFHAGRSGFSGADFAGKCRALLASLLSVKEPARIIFAPNATHALNILLHGFPLSAGSAVITTEAEHNSVLRPLYYLAKKKNFAVHFVPVNRDGRVSLSDWEAAVRRYSPQLAVFTHASNVTGAVNDAALLAKIAKKGGAGTLLDASQSLGLVPVHPTDMDLDMVVFTGHKYLLGPPGTGGLYLGPGIDLEPVWVGGTGIKSDLAEMPPELPTRFEAGTPNDPAFAGLAAALSWAADNAFDSAELTQKTERLAAGLSDAGAKVINVQAPRTPVISFTLDGWSVEDAGEILQKSFGIVCRTGLHCAPRIHTFLNTAPAGTIRFSLSRFTTDAEIDYCLKAVKGLLYETI